MEAVEEELRLARSRKKEETRSSLQVKVAETAEKWVEELVRMREEKEEYDQMKPDDTSADMLWEEFESDDSIVIKEVQGEKENTPPESLTVSAADKSPGKQNNITVTSGKGGLSKEAIEGMVKEAEKFKLTHAKNKLESYCFNMKTTLDDEKVKDKISEDDRKAISNKWDEAIKWLDANQLAEVEEFNEKQKEVEGVCDPIITKLYADAGGAPGGMPGGSYNFVWQCGTFYLSQLCQKCLTWQICAVLAELATIEEVLIST